MRRDLHVDDLVEHVPWDVELHRCGVLTRPLEAAGEGLDHPPRMGQGLLVAGDLPEARELAGLAGREVEMAQKMREAERRRFEQGASDFFLVNLREEAEALIRRTEFGRVEVGAPGVEGVDGDRSALKVAVFNCMVTRHRG